MRKRRGHYCRICHSFRPNETFSGKGRRDHICKRCSRLPKAEREQILFEDEIYNYLRQSRISEENISRLKKLVASPYERITELAKIVLEVAEIKPHKKRRLKELARKRRDLLQKLEETGLILAHHW